MAFSGYKKSEKESRERGGDKKRSHGKESQNRGKTKTKPGEREERAEPRGKTVKKTRKSQGGKAELRLVRVREREMKETGKKRNTIKPQELLGLSPELPYQK